MLSFFLPSTKTEVEFRNDIKNVSDRLEFISQEGLNIQSTINKDNATLNMIRLKLENFVAKKRYEEDINCCSDSFIQPDFQQQYLRPHEQPCAPTTNPLAPSFALITELTTTEDTPDEKRDELPPIN
ncbi:hypothetical protein EIN_487710 [Entamoeba invadens IP1]|uniref:Uncharacterized protein n=1 Tax=Entamoeba invadens IP1 TaxID=370355 RepID=A0A0A1U503_ENTIV|nr:hypothetical protein EIN_487710 [Entamoeba invadens IP1]ELP89269.1 hypothetical protein EIN_487710 [Entamoeba invadens IP1]|eukprot:XP_004256040.1 hypothetical protein EIN_487710 [Entamoeba invadens IP1]